ncbi:MAG: serine--tRNA ligase [Candidatus Paceibacterota bacterium]
MLDINFIKDNKELIGEGARKKRIDFDVNKLLSVDEERRSLLQEVEKLREKQNKANEKISEAEGSEKNSAIEDMRTLKEELRAKEEELQKVMKKWRELMILVPNIPDVTVPEGESDEDNKELRQWGAKPKFSFTPKSHTEIMASLDMADFERGSKVSGFRGYFLKNDAFLLSFAIWQHAQNFFLRKGGFTPVLAPSIINKEVFLGTGYIPQGEDDLYKTQDEQYLSGTAEVPLMGYYMDEVIDKKSLPIKLLGFSPCFRREAGSHGKDTKGLMRVHEFYKFEQLILCEANHEESVKWHEWINDNVESFMQELEIPHRVVANCGADLGLGQVKKYDVELWVPSENKYREISSASYFHDFQSRRLNIRYRDSDGKMYFVHSLNSTAAPTPRLLISLIENNQQEDGSISIPKALQPYMGGREKIELLS